MAHDLEESERTMQSVFEALTVAAVNAAAFDGETGERLIPASALLELLPTLRAHAARASDVAAELGALQSDNEQLRARLRDATHGPSAPAAGRPDGHTGHDASRLAAARARSRRDMDALADECRRAVAEAKAVAAATARAAAAEERLRADRRVAAAHARSRERLADEAARADREGARADAAELRAGEAEAKLDEARRALLAIRTIHADAVGALTRQLRAARGDLPPPVPGAPAAADGRDGRAPRARGQSSAAATAGGGDGDGPRDRLYGYYPPDTQGVGVRIDWRVATPPRAAAQPAILHAGKEPPHTERTPAAAPAAAIVPARDDHAGEGGGSRRGQAVGAAAPEAAREAAAREEVVPAAGEGSAQLEPTPAAASGTRSRTAGRARAPGSAPAVAGGASPRGSDGGGLAPAADEVEPSAAAQPRDAASASAPSALAPAPADAAAPAAAAPAAAANEAPRAGGGRVHGASAKPLGISALVRAQEVDAPPAGAGARSMPSRPSFALTTAH
ncbi:hypothetical protein KFE25_011225 [Diacronema lutheri]|uniref:Uncharacterized protein n=1 Tax=Diacronema lutheri TaxID=2081491 RepID=A0A8J5XFR0_DIALT|nr:hypothetical protein KFE25_011225 [Diacronema lutheri]